MLKKGQQRIHYLFANGCYRLETICTTSACSNATVANNSDGPVSFNRLCSYRLRRREGFVVVAFEYLPAPAPQIQGYLNTRQGTNQPGRQMRRATVAVQAGEVILAHKNDKAPRQHYIHAHFTNEVRRVHLIHANGCAEMPPRRSVDKRLHLLAGARLRALHRSCGCASRHNRHVRCPPCVVA